MRNYLISLFVLLSYCAGAQIAPAKYQEPVTFTTQQDHHNMMDQLGIKSLRPGPSGNESAPNHANYDESKANPYPELPDVLTLKNGRKVTTPELWWNQRRPEIVEDMEREVYGRLPKNIPPVTWKVEIEERELVGRTPVIANCGFLVEIDHQKIIIDGLFKLGHNRYPTPDTSTQRLLVSNQYPFDNIDLILVSHTHEDHFDNEMVLTCMWNNPSAKLICPQQVIDSLSENETIYNKIKTRIIGCTPDTYTSQLIHIGNIEIHACRLAHVGERFKYTQNIAFLIFIEGKSIFHTGDSDPFQIDKYTGIKISELNVDIGLINEDFGKIENAGFSREFINAKYNIAMHFPDYVAVGWIESLKDKPDLFPNPFIFIKEMEKRIFYTGQGK